MTDGSPTFHPDPEVLLSYAAGGLDEATAVLIATHLALCPRCRSEVGRLEAVGAALTESIDPVPMSSDALAGLMARLDEPAPDESSPVLGPAPGPAFDDDTLRTVPAPLRDYLGADLSALPWKWRGPSVRELPLEIGRGPARATLIKVAPGAAMPAHTHSGVETTLVLRGAFVDEAGRFARGDVETATAEVDHRPVATPDGECICFAVVDGPLRLTGPVGRLFNRFLRL